MTGTCVAVVCAGRAGAWNSSVCGLCGAGTYLTSSGEGASKISLLGSNVWMCLLWLWEQELRARRLVLDAVRGHIRLREVRQKGTVSVCRLQPCMRWKGLVPCVERTDVFGNHIKVQRLRSFDGLGLAGSTVASDCIACGPGTYSTSIGTLDVMWY